MYMIITDDKDESESIEVNNYHSYHDKIMHVPMVARGGRLGLPKASMLDADCFVVRLPRKSLLLKRSVTSGMM